MLACNSKEDAVLPYYNTPDLTPVWQQDGGKHTIADFSFVDQDSNVVTNHTFDDKVYIANFFFTSCPGICPQMNGNLRVVADSLINDDRIRFISHSVTPYIDNVHKLKEYADVHGINTGQWHLVTGTQGDIYKLARQSYFADEEMGFNADSTDFLHTERVILVDRDRHIRGVYNGTVELEMQRMMDDIHLLLDEQ